MMPYQQHLQAQQLQPGYPKRRQSSSPGGFNRVASGGELALESSTGLSQILNQPLSQGHVSWSPQAPIYAGLPQIQQPPPMLQHFKQQLSSLQIPSLQHNLSGALKLPSPRIPGMTDILVSDSIKHELVDQGEGSQFSPSTQVRKQNQRSWGYSE
jgi:hypothetical protein